MKKLKYFDGLRGFSVIAVMLFHTNLPYFIHGWLGVQVFFTISGFLITDILIHQRPSTKYFSSFYARRTLRIFPIFYMALIFVTIVAKVAFHSCVHDFFWYLFYMQNIILGLKNFSPAFPQVMNHTWTLAVEEQFYLIFPLIVYYTNNRQLKIVCVLLIGLALATNVIFLWIFPLNSINWTNTVSNFDFLAGGALLAAFFSDGNQNLAGKFLLVINVLICTVVLVLVFLSFDFSFVFRKIKLTELKGQCFLTCSVPIIMYLIYLCRQERNRIFDFLFENRIMTFLGKISYGIYLYHLIVFEGICPYLQSLFPMPRLIYFILLFLITFGMAIFSYYAIEQKILKLKSRFPYT